MSCIEKYWRKTTVIIALALAVFGLLSLVTFLLKKFLNVELPSLLSNTPEMVFEVSRAIASTLIATAIISFTEGKSKQGKILLIFGLIFLIGSFPFKSDSGTLTLSNLHTLGVNPNGFMKHYQDAVAAKRLPTEDTEITINLASKYSVNINNFILSEQEWVGDSFVDIAKSICRVHDDCLTCEQKENALEIGFKEPLQAKCVPEG